MPDPQPSGKEMKADDKGLTVDTIKDDGMTGPEIETVLKKKTTYIYSSYCMRLNTFIM